MSKSAYQVLLIAAAALVAVIFMDSLIGTSKASAKKSYNPPTPEVCPITIEVCESKERGSCNIYFTNNSQQTLTSCKFGMLNIPEWEICKELKPGQSLSAGGSYVKGGEISFRSKGYAKKTIIMPDTLPQAIDESTLTWATTDLLDDEVTDTLERINEAVGAFEE